MTGNRRTSRARLTYRARIALILICNIVVLLAIDSASTQAPMIGAYVAVTGFWILLMFRSPFSTNLYTPGNYHILLFALSLVVGASLMPLDSMTGRFWDYSHTLDRARTMTLYVSIVWLVGFGAYLTGFTLLKPRRSLEWLPQRREPAAAWMWMTGIILVGAGVLGLSLAAGSVTAALALGGTRAGADALGDGSFRYTIWMEAAPVGAGLLWYYVWERLDLKPVGAAILVMVCYVPLVPFYIYSSGRARAIIPLLLVLALYNRYAYRMKLRWMVLGFVASVPILSLWAQYRAGAESSALSPDKAIQVLTADFGRYDVSAVAIAGAVNSGLPPLYGQTVLAAMYHTRLVPRPAGPQPIGGTEAMARAMSQNSQYRGASTYATPLIVEGFLNFGLFGVIVFLFALGLAVGKLDQIAIRSGVIPYLFALAAALKLPFGVALEVSASRLIWVVAFPFALIWLLKRHFSFHRTVG